MQRRGRQRSMIAVGGVLALGLLFWARLIVVSDLPRMAVAEPDEETPASVSDNAPSFDRAVGETSDAPTLDGTRAPEADANADFAENERSRTFK